jgi:putative transposase
MGPNHCWSADFVSDKLSDGRAIRILPVIDQLTRECIWLEVDRSMSGAKVVAALTGAITERGAGPHSITLDNGSEFAVRAIEAWAIQTLATGLESSYRNHARGGSQFRIQES